MIKTYQLTMIDRYPECDDRYDFSNQYGRGLCKIRISSAAETVTVQIECSTAAECDDELNGQLTDGIFESYRVSGVKEIEA